MCALLCSSASNSWNTGRTLAGVQVTYTSSKKAKSLSPSFNLALMATRALCIPRLKSKGINGSPCSPPSPCFTWWTFPMSSSHRNVEGGPWNNRMKGINFAPSTMPRNPLSMALRDMRSYAPIPSNGQNSGFPVFTGQRLDHVSDTFRARPRRQSVLERVRGCLPQL